MKQHNKKYSGSPAQESGYILIVVLFLSSISILIITSLVVAIQNNARMQSVTNTNNERYYAVEETLGEVTAWFQTNKTGLIELFEDASFEDNLSVVVDYTVDTENSNQVPNFTVPSTTRVDSGGVPTANFPILSNNTDFGAPSFPSIDDGLGGTIDFSNDFITAFPNADNGGVNTKIILMGVIDSSQGKSPIFRIDAITGNNPDRGTNLYSYVYGAFEQEMTTETTTATTTSQSYGFYGHQGVSMTGSSFCKARRFSYNSGSNTWNMLGTENNCSVSSPAQVSLNGGKTKVYGAAFSNTTNGVNSASKVLNNNANGCAQPNCHNHTLNTFTNDWLTDGTCSSWTTLNVSSNMTIDTNSNNCYDTITIQNKKTLTFSYSNGDPSNTFYVQNLIYQGGKSEAQIYIDSNFPDPSSESIVLYLNQVGNDHLNGKRFTNTNFAPHQLQFVYTGNTQLQLNGGANMRAHLYSPYAKIVGNGNFAFYGAINAYDLEFSGTIDLFSDVVEHDFAVTSTTTQTVLGDASLDFQVTKINQRFR